MELQDYIHDGSVVCEYCANKQKALNEENFLKFFVPLVNPHFSDTCKVCKKNREIRAAIGGVVTSNYLPHFPREITLYLSTLKEYRVEICY